MKPTLLQPKNIITQSLTDNIQIKILSDQVNGAKNVATGIVILEPGSRTPPHVRTVEEIIFVTKGTASGVTTAGEVYKMAAGECVFIPPGVEHYHENPSSETAEQLYIFAPQGPEASLRELPVYNSTS